MLKTPAIDRAPFRRLRAITDEIARYRAEASRNIQRTDAALAAVSRALTATAARR